MTTKFHLSGFGPFNGVANNPTTTLMKTIEEYLKQNPLPAELQAEVESVTIYETSAVGTMAQFAGLLSSAGLNQRSDSKDKHIFLHFGVNSEQLAFFRLERTAWNEASFRVPDERGWTPKNQEIIQTNGTIEHCFMTALPLTTLKEQLGTKNYNVELSDDAGRFLCNFIYYTSLHFGKLHNTDSLFIHVPTFEVIPQEVQIRFVRELVIAIASSCPPNAVN